MGFKLHELLGCNSYKATNRIEIFRMTVPRWNEKYNDSVQVKGSQETLNKQINHISGKNLCERKFLDLVAVYKNQYFQSDKESTKKDKL